MLIFSKPHQSLQRLPRSAYQGHALVFFTDCTLNRAPILSQPLLARACVQTWMEISQTTDVLPIAYVVMPDHTHVIMYGLTLQSNCLLVHYQWKQRSSALINSVRNTKGAKVWQHQSYDRVLHKTERDRLPLTQTIQYLLNNPVRRGLVHDIRNYSFAGSCLQSTSPVDSEQWWNDLCTLVELE